jgi:hypothetical protein
MEKIKLVENVLVPSSMVEKLNIPLTEAAIEGAPYKALAVYRFPFTRPGQKNLNGRIYSFKLWDRIFKLFQTRSTVSLCDHPEDEGDPARIWAVLRNPGYSADKTLAKVDCYILDNELGRTANGVLLAGGEIGLSSSGIGDFEADGITVDADSYELERFFDWVLNPSYSVFGRIDDEKISEASMSDKDNKNNSDGSAKLNEKSGGTGVKTLSLREKREFEASLRRIYEDVKGIKSVRERLNRAKEALTFYEDVDVESYKKEFEELAKEAEKEFESTLVKAEQADAIKKEADKTSKEAEEVKHEAEELKKENDELKKENEILKKQVKESQSFKKESDNLLSSMAKGMRRTISYDDYDKLREYALKATKLYSETKVNCNILQMQLQEANAKARAIEEAQIVQYQKDAMARARIEEVKQRNIETQILAEKRLNEAKEAEFMQKVNPEVLEYFNELVHRGENVNDLRTQILSKKTIDEAQMLFLKSKKKTPSVMESVPDRDLSAPLPVSNYRQVMPDVQMNSPKGFI